MKDRACPAAGYCPVPLSATRVVVGVAGAATLTFTEALRCPVAVGVNVTLTVQLFPAGRLTGKESKPFGAQLMDWIAKSRRLVPLMLIPVSVSGMLAPVLVTVTV